GMVRASADEGQRHPHVHAPDPKPRELGILECIAGHAGKASRFQQRQHVEPRVGVDRGPEPSRRMHAARKCNGFASPTKPPRLWYSPGFWTYLIAAVVVSVDFPAEPASTVNAAGNDPAI